MLKRERKALVACRKGHNRALGQSESQPLLPARHPPMEETCPILSPESHCLLYTCSTSHHSEITSMTTCTCTPLNRTKQIQASLFRAERSHHSKQTQPQAERSLQEQPPAHPSHTLSKALAHSCAVAHLHSWSKPGFDTSSSHWKCQMRSRWLGWKQEQQPKLSGEQLIFGTHENKQKYLLIPSNKPDSTSTYSSSSSYFTKGCFSAANCSLWEMPRFNLQPEGCLTIMQGSLC